MNDEKETAQIIQMSLKCHWMLVADFWFSPSFACIASVALLVANYMLLKCNEFNFNMLTRMWIIKWLPVQCKLADCSSWKQSTFIAEFPSTKLALFACENQF